MANNTHKGSEFNNVSETWDQNERKRNNGNGPADDNAANETAPAGGLEQVIRREATEYDTESAEDRLLGGNRATFNDATDANDSGE
jgi:hypothetical protein